MIPIQPPPPPPVLGTVPKLYHVLTPPRHVPSGPLSPFKTQKPINTLGIASEWFFKPSSISGWFYGNCFPYCSREFSFFHSRPSLRLGSRWQPMPYSLTDTSSISQKECAYWVILGQYLKIAQKSSWYLSIGTHFPKMFPVALPIVADLSRHLQKPSENVSSHFPRTSETSAHLSWPHCFVLSRHQLF